MRPSPTFRLFTLAVLLSGCTGTAPAALEAPAPPVHAERVEPSEIVPTSLATAEILANRQSNMRSETAGRVVSVLVEAGDRVDEGQVLLLEGRQSPVQRLQLGVTPSHGHGEQYEDRDSEGI